MIESKGSNGKSVQGDTTCQTCQNQGMAIISWSALRITTVTSSAAQYAESLRFNAGAWEGSIDMPKFRGFIAQWNRIDLKWKASEEDRGIVGRKQSVLEGLNAMEEM
jgi:hypothetical protein